MPLAKPREGTSVGFHVYPIVTNEGTLGDPETVLWSSIHHLCSRSVAENVAAPTHGITRKRDREAVARSLKLYIRQAAEFYEAARSAKPNTAPLIYYYSFLNLAKALCELRQPRFHERTECYHHGLTWRPNPRRLADLSREWISVTTRGVWHTLWESLMLVRCPAANPARLRIRHLFSYCPEISSEFRRATHDWIRLLDIEEPDVLWDRTASEAWLRLSVQREELRGFRLSLPTIAKQIGSTRSRYLEVKSPKSGLRTIESTTPARLGRSESPLEALRGDILAINAFAHLGPDRKLRYCIPLQAQLPIRLPQLMVSYTILFWLGSLVRYDPHSVSALMDSEYWMLIDGFMSQSRLWLLELFEWAFYQAETTLWVSR